jgi:hypothetical protein
MKVTIESSPLTDRVCSHGLRVEREKEYGK